MGEEQMNMAEGTQWALSVEWNALGIIVLDKIYIYLFHIFP